MRWQPANRNVQAVDVDYLVRPARLRHCEHNDTLPIDWNAKRARLRYLEMLNMNTKPQKTRGRRFMDVAYDVVTVAIPVITLLAGIVIVACATVQMVSNW